MGPSRHGKITNSRNVNKREPGVKNPDGLRPLWIAWQGVMATLKASNTRKALGA